MGRIFTVFFIICFARVNALACIISEDTIIRDDVKEGIKVVESCTLKFENERDIKIGDSKNSCSGIELGLGVELKMDVSSNFNVSVYGGYYINNDNEYDCAGIYVPQSSSLIIESLGSGSLIVYPFDRGAGIGGNGVLIEKNDKLEDNRNAGEIIIKRGLVVIQNIIESSKYGIGAKIGGGGTCNNDNQTKVLSGGNLEKFEITNGGIVVIGDCEEAEYGVGAIIGGGGVANLNDSIQNIFGGNLVEANIQGGTLDIKDCGKYYGSGAIIGGGGIYNYKRASNIRKGQIFSLDIYEKASIKKDVCGSGSVYNGGEEIESGLQMKNTTVNLKTWKNHLLEKFLDIVMIASGAFMVFELVT